MSLQSVPVSMHSRGNECSYDLDKRKQTGVKTVEGSQIHREPVVGNIGLVEEAGVVFHSPEGIDCMQVAGCCRADSSVTKEAAARPEHRVWGLLQQDWECTAGKTGTAV